MQREPATDTMDTILHFRQEVRNGDAGREKLETRSRFDIQNRRDPSWGTNVQNINKAQDPPSESERLSSELQVEAGFQPKTDPTQVALLFTHTEPQTLPITSTGRPVVFESPKDMNWRDA